MRKIILSVATALAVPTIASAASNHSVAGGNTGGSRGNVGVTAKSFNGASFNAGANTNTRVTRNVAVNNNAQINNAHQWNGQHWASDDHHHHHHHGWWLPYAAFGAYAAYDQCWQTIWTPSGWQRVYVCGPDNYSYY